MNVPRIGDDAEEGRTEVPAQRLRVHQKGQRAVRENEYGCGLVQTRC